MLLVRIIIIIMIDTYQDNCDTNSNNRKDQRMKI